MLDYNAEFFQRALDATKDFILIKGERSRLLWANKSFLDYYGMTKAQLYHLVDGPQSDPDDTLQYVRDDQTVFDIAAHLDIPAEMVTDSRGDARAFHTIKSPIFHDGHVKQVIGVSRRVEDEEIAKTTYDHQDAKAFSVPLRGISGNFPLPMMLIDIQGRIVNGSPLWKESFGSYDEGNPNLFFDETYPLLKGLTAKIEVALKTQIVQQETYKIEKNNGNEIFRFRVNCWTYPNGAVGGVTITASDMTDIVESHEELQRHQKELKELNADLIRSNHDLDSFAYSACHDLKSPLKAFKNLLDWVQNDEDNQLSTQSKGDLDLLVGRANRMSDLLDSLFEYSQVGKTQHEIAVLSLQSEVQAILEVIEVPPGFQVVCVGDDMSLSCKSVPFRQVLQNLIENAIKHHHRTTGKICVSGQEDEKGCLFEVSDDGPGIPERHHQRIFELFKTLKSKDEVEGSGVGLALVEKIVSREGGRVSVSSIGGQGAKFQIFWPTVKKEGSVK